MSVVLPRGRWLVWLGLLAGAACLALFGDKTPSGAARPGAAVAVPSSAAVPISRSSPVGRGAQPVEPIQRLLARADLVTAALPLRADLFATPSWRQRPPAVPATMPPMPAASVSIATALPPPYRVIGKKLEAAAWEVFLGRDELSFIARAGDTLEATWRVERIEPPILSLRHLSSGQAQTLNIGDAL